MNEWSESVWIAVSIIVMSVVIFFSLQVMSLGKEVMNTLNEQQETVDLIKEFREFNQYKDKTVYAQDVVSLVLMTRGAPYVHVKIGLTDYYWNSNSALTLPVSQATPYTSTDILTVVDVNKVYDSTIVYGGNGEIIGVDFVGR